MLWQWRGILSGKLLASDNLVEADGAPGVRMLVGVGACYLDSRRLYRRIRSMKLETPVSREEWGRGLGGL